MSRSTIYKSLRNRIRAAEDRRDGIKLDAVDVVALAALLDCPHVKTTGTRLDAMYLDRQKNIHGIDMEVAS